MTHENPAAVIALSARDLLGYFLRRVGSPDDAADLVSDTMIRAWKVISRMPPDDEAARMWLFGIARNVLHHHRRSTRRRDAMTERVALSVRQATVPDQDAQIEVRAAVARLPTDLAELIRLIHWDGFTVEAAAAHLGVPASTARSRHARAKQLLRAALHEDSFRERAEPETPRTPAAHRTGRTS